MNLLQQISENVSSYDVFLEKLVQKVDRFEVELVIEKRLGLSIHEADDYYQKDIQKPSQDVVNFKPQSSAQPPPPAQNSSPSQRIHLVFDPKTNKISDVIKTDIRSNPGEQFEQANQQQVEAAVQHMQKLKPEMAQKVQNGSIAVWIPRAEQNQQTGGGSRMLGMVSPKPMNNPNVRDMSANQLVNTMNSTKDWKLH